MSQVMQNMIMNMLIEHYQCSVGVPYLHSYSSTYVQIFVPQSINKQKTCCKCLFLHFRLFPIPLFLLPNYEIHKHFLPTQINDVSYLMPIILLPKYKYDI